MQQMITDNANRYFEKAMTLYYRSNFKIHGMLRVTNQENCVIKTDYDLCICLTEMEMSLVFSAMRCLENVDTRIDCDDDLLPRIIEEPLRSYVASFCTRRADGVPRIIFSSGEDVIISSNDADNAYSVLCAIVIYNVKNRTLLRADPSNSMQLSELLAGLIATNSLFADVYFMEIKRILRNAEGDRQTALIQRLVELIKQIDRWKDQYLRQFGIDELKAFLSEFTNLNDYAARASFADTLLQRMVISPLRTKPGRHQKVDAVLEFMESVRKIDLQRRPSIVAFLEEIDPIHFKSQVFFS